MNTPYASPPLWDFALAFYAQPSVAQACLQLQDEYHANVCLLIGLHWLDAREQYVADIEFAALKIHIQSWTQNVVEPLRLLRRRLKLPIEPLVQDVAQTQLRALLKQAELMAEKKLLIEIERWVELLPYQTNLQATPNFARYCAQLGAPQHLIEIVRTDIRSE